MEDITIVPLTPDRLDGFLGFFENSIPADEWGYRCYCTPFCAMDNSAEEGMEKPEVRREASSRYIKKGKLRGYLACEGDRIVGWCNANDRGACRYCFGVKWIVGAELPETEERGLSVFCFEIAPRLRGKHIASALLERVLSDARNEGYDFVEAYPAKKAEGETENYTGPLALYEKAGFRRTGEAENCLILRKKLNEGTD